jgi:hypothetical protein
VKDELDKQLCEKYPKIFRDRHADMRNTAMCWGFPGSGWYDIIDELCSKIQTVCDREGFQVVALQVKEKFGGLRFYIGAGNDEIFNLIDEAESKSFEVCETCGKPGKLVGHGWVYTACPEHTRKGDERNEPKTEQAP